MKIGKVIGLEISNFKNINTIHLIAHSAGAFIAKSLINLKNKMMLSCVSCYYIYIFILNQLIWNYSLVR